MLARVLSAAVNGIEAYPVEVEVNCGWGDTVVVIVGLPDAAVKESRDRVLDGADQFRLQISHGPLHHQSGASGREEGRAEF